MSNKRNRNRERNERKELKRAWGVTMQQSYPHLWAKAGVCLTSEVENIKEIIEPLAEALREYIKLPEPFFLDANEIKEGSGMYVGQLIHPDYGVIGISYTIDDHKETARWKICKNFPVIPTVGGNYPHYKESLAQMHVQMREHLAKKEEGHGGL